ncbi:MAG: hypothetical protein ACP5VQ_10085, partial [Phycisphaerae bacterium]
ATANRRSFAPRNNVRFAHRCHVIFMDKTITFKLYTNFEHMIIHNNRGVETRSYAAMIGTLLMNLYTQQNPTTYTVTTLVSNNQTVTLY